MAERSAVHIIKSLRNRWTAIILLGHMLTALACGFCFSQLLGKYPGYPLWWGFPAGLLVLFLLLAFDRSWNISDTDIARFLNNRYPQLEESAELLLVPASSLPLLQQLQAKKSERSLIDIHKAALFYPKLFTSFLVAIIALILTAVLSFIPSHWSPQAARQQQHPTEERVVNKGLLPAISSFSIHIQPPAYTRKPARSQQQFNVLAEEGARVSWRIRTRTDVKTVQLIINDSKTISFKALDKQHTNWEAGLVVGAPGFYQLKTDSVLSELYPLEIIKDQLPFLNIQTPGPNTIIDFGKPPQVMLVFKAEDDYGIKNVSVAATISSGSGEGVKFKQEQINFGGAFAKQLPEYHLKKMIDLTGLGMQPGDELYFYVKAIDNRDQEKRSDVFIVSIADTNQLIGAEGLVNGISIKPEYFRSQRQIIIETEQLIKDRPTLSGETFRNKSNNLGIDQKLLRLRYGKFLGEEASSNEDAHLSTERDLNDFGNGGKVLDAYTDMHDDAEVADFFEIGSKNQLKATLTEMWKAELQLRTFNPVKALPFEYKALRLLKDLQQKSRAYVAKTNIVTTPLKMEKRLTADLSKIIAPSIQVDVRTDTSMGRILQQALGVLEQLRTYSRFDAETSALLQRASLQLAISARARPSAFISSLESIKRIIAAMQFGSAITPGDINVVENALQKIIDAPASLPSGNKRAPSIDLPQAYFSNLNKLKNR